MMDKFLAKFQEIKATAQAGIQRFVNKGFLEAVIASFCIVSISDDNIDPTEKKKLISILQNNEDLKVFDTNDIIDIINRLFARFDFDKDVAIADCLKIIKKFEGKDEADMIIRVSISIAKADNDFADSEKDAIRMICQTLNLSPTTYGL